MIKKTTLYQVTINPLQSPRSITVLVKEPDKKLLLETLLKTVNDINKENDEDEYEAYGLSLEVATIWSRDNEWVNKWHTVRAANVEIGTMRIDEIEYYSWEN